MSKTNSFFMALRACRAQYVEQGLCGLLFCFSSGFSLSLTRVFDVGDRAGDIEGRFLFFFNELRECIFGEMAFICLQVFLKLCFRVFEMEVLHAAFKTRLIQMLNHALARS